MSAKVGQDDGSPSSTVVMVRWTDESVDVLVLGDSTAVIYQHGDLLDVVHDDRLDLVGEELRERYKTALRGGEGFNEGHRQRLIKLQAEQARMRNRPDGFWIAATDSGAANEAQLRRFPVGGVDAVLIASDGFADGVLTYGILDWRQVRRMILSDGADAALATVECAERQDSDGRRWPRSKLHDDKTLALIEFPRL